MRGLSERPGAWCALKPTTTGLLPFVSSAILLAFPASDVFMVIVSGSTGLDYV
jgi:hypothetical protein